MTDAVSTTAMGTIVGVIGLMIGAIGSTIRATWKVAELEKGITDKINQDLTDIREQLATEHSQVMKQFGDSLTAQSEKIRQVELWNRDNFVRRADFDRAIDAVAARMDIGFAKIEAKIDKLQARS